MLSFLVWNYRTISEPFSSSSGISGFLRAHFRPPLDFTWYVFRSISNFVKSFPKHTSLRRGGHPHLPIEGRPTSWAPYYLFAVLVCCANRHVPPSTRSTGFCVIWVCTSTILNSIWYRKWLTATHKWFYFKAKPQTRHLKHNATRATPSAPVNHTANNRTTEIQ